MTQEEKANIIQKKTVVLFGMEGALIFVQQAVDKARDLSNTIEGALSGEEPYPATYYRMCKEIIEYLTKIDKIV